MTESSHRKFPKIKRDRYISSNTMSIEPKISRGLRSLEFQSADPNTGVEYDALKAEAAAIEKWWSEDRWKNVKRDYSAIDVVCLRNSADTRKANFSNVQSNRLYNLLTKLHKVGGYSHTFGSLDPVQVIQMAPHLSSIYVSGWQCSSTASTTNEPGPDFADYPMDTVPNKVSLQEYVCFPSTNILTCFDRRQQRLTNLLELNCIMIVGKNLSDLRKLWMAIIRVQGFHISHQ